MALGLLEEGLACARAAGSTLTEAQALSLLSFFTRFGRDEQIRLGEEAIAKARASGDRRLLGGMTGNLSSVMSRLGETEGNRADRGGRIACCVAAATSSVWASRPRASPPSPSKRDFAAARARLNEALELARLIEDMRGIGFAQEGFGWLELFQGNLVRAISYFEEAAAIARRLGGRRSSAEAIWGLAQVAAAAGDADRRRALRGRGRVRRPAGFDPTESFPCGHVDTARAALGEPAWQKAWADGAELGLDAALGLAISLDPATLAAAE